MLAGTSRMTAEQARTMTNIKKIKFRDTLRMIRHLCDHSIKTASAQGYNAIWFDVPTSMWEREAYKLNEMSHALATQLHGDGYNITGNVDRLHISWQDNNEKINPKPHVLRKNKKVVHFANV